MSPIERAWSIVVEVAARPVAHVFGVLVWYPVLRAARFLGDELERLGGVWVIEPLKRVARFAYLVLNRIDRGMSGGRRG